MPQQLTTKIATLKAAWDTTLYKRSALPAAKSETLSLKAPILIDPNSFVFFKLRAPTAAHFNMTGIEIPSAAKPWTPAGAGTPKDPTNKNLAINRMNPGFSLDMRVNIAKLCKLRLHTPVMRNLTNRTGTTPPTSTRSRPSSILIKWSNQRFPPICSSDWITAFLAENCANPPKEVIIGKKRFFITAETKKPGQLKLNQLEGNDLPYTIDEMIST